MLFSGDENHIVMNERVQALAGSIYEEFEQVSHSAGTFCPRCTEPDLLVF